MSIAERLYEETSGFDFVDRVVVFIFLTLNFTVAIAVISDRMTAAEAAEIAPAFNALSYILLFFLFWPLIRGLLTHGGRWIGNRYFTGAEQA